MLPPIASASRRDVLRDVSGWVAGAVSLVLLLTVSQLPGSLPWLLPGLLAVAALTIRNPAAALIGIGFAIPLIRAAGRPWAPLAAWAELLVVAVAAGWFLRRGRRGRDDELDAPIRVAAAVVVASLAVVTTFTQWRLTGDPLPRSWLTTYWRGYFLVESSGNAVDSAMRLLESLLLFRAASLISQQRPEWVRSFAASLVAAAAVAGAMNVWAVWDGAAGGVQAFVQAFTRARLNVAYPDVNAAGSYFILMLPVAAAFALTPRARIWAIPASALIAAGLWTSGSRTAIIAGLVAALLPIGARVKAARLLRPQVLGAAMLLLILAGAAAIFLPHRGNQRSAEDAVRVRWELTLSAARMLASAPLFGVGVGNFINLSGKFASKELLALFPPALYENAHNNFAQISAELGLAGLAAFGWVAVVAGRRLVWLTRPPSHDAPPARFGEAGKGGPLRWGMVIGIVAFALTCLGGHPLLIDEPAFTFWLLLGTAVGWAGPHLPDAMPAGGPALADRAATSTGWRARWRNLDLVTALTIALAITVPVRWYSERAALDLSDVAFGLTDWYTGRDGVMYRLAGRTSLFYLPAAYEKITIPIRATEPHTEIDLVIRVDGAVVEQTTIRTGNWQVLRLPLPTPSSRSRYRRLELEARTVPQTPRMLYIGRITPY